MTKLVTPLFRGSFVQVMTPKAFSKDQDPKFSMVIPILKDDEFIAKLDEAVKQAAMDKWNEVPKKLKIVFKDGDKEEEKYEWAGCRVITASNKTKPGCVIKTEQGIVEAIDPEDIYSGAYFKASIRPYAYEYEKTKGVAISLDNVIKIRDGEKFTSKTSAKDDFADFVDGDWD